MRTRQSTKTLFRRALLVLPALVATASSREPEPAHCGDSRSGTRAAGAGPRRGRPALNTLLRAALIPALLLLPATALPAAAQQVPTPAELAAFDAYVTAGARDWRVPGLAVAIVSADSVLFVKGYGVRELGRPDAVDAGTRFAIGSTTKAMTALALGMLVDEDRIEWDAPVITYLPHFRMADPWVTRELTVRDLLTHRGGLGNADQLWTTVDYTTDEIIRRVATITPAYSLRSQFIYQNIMYAVAGAVIEAAAGVSWAEFLQTRIFDPIGMRATEAYLADLAGQSNIAVPHVEIDGTIQPGENRSVDAVGPAGSVWSSAGDMALWSRFVLDSARVNGRRLVTAETYTELLSPQVIAPLDMYPTTTLTRPHFFTYGLGWFLHDYSGEAVAMHTGSINGMSALIGLLPDREVGIYVLANLDHAELRHALMYRFFDLSAGLPERDWSADLLALYGDLRERSRAGRLEAEQRRAADTQPGLPLDRYAGTYVSPTYGRAVVTLRDGRLHLEFGRRAGTLSHWEYESFRAAWTDGGAQTSLIVFASDGAGRTTAVRAFGITFARERTR